MLAGRWGDSDSESPHRLESRLPRWERGIRLSHPTVHRGVAEKERTRRLQGSRSDPTGADHDAGGPDLRQQFSPGYGVFGHELPRQPRSAWDGDFAVRAEGQACERPMLSPLAGQDVGQLC